MYAPKLSKRKSPLTLGQPRVALRVVIVLTTELQKVLAGLPGDIVLHLMTGDDPALRPRWILAQGKSLSHR